jgi:multidrug resistance efflux pump
MKKTSVKMSNDYKSRITKSDSETQNELVDLNVEQAKNTLEQGILSIKSKMIEAQSEVKKAENNVKSAERELETIKSSTPFNVQYLLDARTAILQAEINLAAAKEVFGEFSSALDFLEETKVELFPL